MSARPGWEAGRGFGGKTLGGEWKSHVWEWGRLGNCTHWYMQGLGLGPGLGQAGQAVIPYIACKQVLGLENSLAEVHGVSLSGLL